MKRSCGPSFTSRHRPGDSMSRRRLKLDETRKQLMHLSLAEFKALVVGPGRCLADLPRESHRSPSRTRSGRSQEARGASGRADDPGRGRVRQPGRKGLPRPAGPDPRHRDGRASDVAARRRSPSRASTRPRRRKSTRLKSDYNSRSRMPSGCNRLKKTFFLAFVWSTRHVTAHSTRQFRGRRQACPHHRAVPKRPSRPWDRRHERKGQQGTPHAGGHQRRIRETSIIAPRLDDR